MKHAKLPEAKWGVLRYLFGMVGIAHCDQESLPLRWLHWPEMLRLGTAWHLYCHGTMLIPTHPPKWTKGGNIFISGQRPVFRKWAAGSRLWYMLGMKQLRQGAIRHLISLGRVRVGHVWWDHLKKCQASHLLSQENKFRLNDVLWPVLAAPG